MNYYNILNLKKEPFSNSPEPEFLFQFPQYSDCLQKLELAVRLRRGINVVIGDIGTGKTTLCRKLIQNFSSYSEDSTEIETHLLLDPAFDSALEFLQTVSSMLGIKDSNDALRSEWHLKERIKDYLFDKGVAERRIVVLIIDEGQKIPENCLEILREFLNYETNEFKLLQIIIFAQKEFRTILRKKANLFDRVNLICHLSPLNFKQMKEMINFRLYIAANLEKLPELFDIGGFVAVYMATGGYPRKVVILCHKVILKMIIRGKKKADWLLVRSCLNENESPVFRKIRWALACLFIFIVAGLSIGSITLQSLNYSTYKPSPAISSKPVVTEINRTKKPEPAANSVISNISNASEVNDISNVNSVSSASNVNNVQDVKMPDTLGKMVMPPKRTLWWTIYNIYGDRGSQIMKGVFAVNPHLQDKEAVTVGTVITFPSIPAGISPVKEGDVFVCLEIGKDLETMYDIFRNNPDEKILPPLAFLSSWNKKRGLEFAVVIEKKFKNIASAKETAGKLPPVIAAKAKILSQWDADTIFFNRRELPN
jgi:general secretion pathway protein A